MVQAPRQSPAGSTPHRAVKSKTYASNHIGFAELRQEAYGQWVRIHGALGIIISTTFRQHSACPGCGGKDRFRLQKDYENTGAWICGGGGNLQMGDGFALLGHVYGWSPAEQLSAVKRVLGLDKDMSPSQTQRLKRQAETYQAERVRLAAAKDERNRQDANILDYLLPLEDAIKRRQHTQRASGRAANPGDDERKLANGLNACLLESYAGGTV